MKRITKSLALSALVLLVALVLKNCILDKPDSTQRAKFRENFQKVEKGMTRQQVKNLLGETNFRLPGESGKSSSQISSWFYTDFRDGGWTPVVDFDSRGLVYESLEYDQDNFCGRMGNDPMFLCYIFY